MISKTGAFEFVDGGRCYSCHVEERADGRADAWWWFGVKGDQNRYAPFRAEADDTESSVQRRIVAYYEDRMARRAWLYPHTRGEARTGS